MAEQKTCTYAVDYDETTEVEIVCGEPAAFEFCGEPYCEQCAHDRLDELEPGHTHEVIVLRRDVSDG